MVGNHIIEFGDGTDFDKKFARLLQFYQLVLSKTGMDKYERVNVQYEKQVIGVKKGGFVSRADSLQAVRNIQQLAALSQTVLTDSTNRQQVTSVQTLNTANSSPAKGPDAEKPSTPVKPTVPKRANNAARQNPPPKKTTATKPPVKQPKAVMPKRSTNH